MHVFIIVNIVFQEIKHKIRLDFIDFDLRNRPTEEYSVACTLLKVRNYKPNIN